MKKKLKRLTSFMLSAAMILPFFAEYPGGICAAETDLKVTIDSGASVTLKDTDKNSYYEISTADELYAFAAANKDGTIINGELTADIDMTGKEWTPICQTVSYHASETPSDAGYSGTFDGKGHTVSNLTVTFNTDTTNTYSHGLFGTVSGTVKNLGMVDFKYQNTTGDTRAGAVAGQVLTGGTVTNCYTVGHSIKTNNNIAGGIAGCNYGGTISNCYALNGSVTGYSDRWGGVVGDCQKDDGALDKDKTYSIISNCYTDDTRVVSSQNDSSNITNCAVKGDDAFSSGEVAYLLNNFVTDGTQSWYQTLSDDEPDTYPVLNTASGTVYCGYEECKAVCYSNEELALPKEPKPHSWLDGKCVVCEKRCSHSLKNDVCTICGALYKITVKRADKKEFEEGEYTYDKDTKVHTINTEKEVIITGATNTETVVIAKDVDANIILDGVSIDVSENQNTCALKIEDNSTGNVTIKLADGTENILKSGRGCAGLQKNGTSGTLTICGDTNDKGSLEATGGNNGAGIGGGDNKTGSGITIEGGTVTATGGGWGAGIGGGYKGIGSKITISGGTVTATGGWGGAGIGGGNIGTGLDITIEGGTVTATGGWGGAGIGGGYNRAGSGIKISCGSVKAVAGGGANAIGGGQYQSAVTPTNGSENVYLLELTVDGTSDVTINDSANYPQKHFEENKLYVYLPAKTAQDPNKVTIGSTTIDYTYDTASSRWLAYDTASSRWLTPVDAPAADDTEFTYNGAEKTYTLAESDYYTITGNKQTNAGTYTVTVALNDGYIWSDFKTTDKTYSFVINKAIPTADMFTYTAPTNLGFDGTEKTANVVVKDGITGIEKITIKYSATPVNVGTYKVSIDVEESDNYAAVSNLVVGEFTIEKADSVIEVAPTPIANLAYNGAEQNLINAGTTDGVLNYSLDGTNYSTAIPTGTNAGTYTVWYKVVGDNNHNDTEPASVEVTIAPKSITVTAENASKTYGEADPTFTYTATGLVDDDTLTGTLSREQGENAGTYAITQGTLANQNYKITFVNGKFTINKGTPTADMFTYTAPTNLDVDGNEKTATVEAKDNISGIGEITIQYYKNGISTVPVECGIYSVKISVAESDNYTDATDLTADDWTFTINHVDADDNGYCDDCGAIYDGIGAHLAGYTLSLNGNIGVNFYMELSDEVANDSNAYMLFTLPDGSEKQVLLSEATQNTTLTEGKTYYVFSCEVSSYEMTQEIKAQMFDGSGNSSKEYSYTVRDYAEFIIDNPTKYSSGDVEFAKAMLNYGACAQTYWNVETADLANKKLNEADRQIAALSATDLEGYKKSATSNELGTFEGFSLVLKSETTLKAYFKPADGVNVNNLTFTAGGNTVTPASSGKYYVLSVENIKAWDLDEDYTFTASDGNATLEFSCSALSYGYSVLNKSEYNTDESLVQLISALYAYQQKSGIYIASNN